jgi:hypothetical protein
MLTSRVCIFVFLSEKGANKQPIVVKIPIATAVRTGNIIIAFEMGDFTRRAAAPNGPPTTDLVASSAFKRRCRSDSRNVTGSLVVRMRDGSGGNSSTSPLVKTTARSMKFCNSPMCQAMCTS